MAFPGCGPKNYVDFLFASSKVHVQMGGENVLSAKDYISPSVIVVLWLQRAKEMQTLKWLQELELSLFA